MVQYDVGFDFTQPVQIVFTAAAFNAGQKTFSQLITNRDPVNTLLIGFERDHQPVDFTGSFVSIIDPLASIVVDGTANVWAVAQTPQQASGTSISAGTIDVDVVPTSLGTSGSPLSIATAIAAGQLPLFIAQSIAAQGISLISPPQLIYNVSAAASGGSGTGLFGASIKPAAGQTSTAALQTWQSASVVGRPVLSTKIYQYELSTGPGQWTTTATPTITACMNMGIRACLCYSPSFNPPTPSDKANMAASISALKALLVGAGAPAPVVTLWQEPQVARNNLSAAQYIAMVQYYAHTDVNGTGVQSLVQLWYDGEGYHTDTAAAYYPGSAYCDGIAVDYYCGGDFNANKSLNTWTAIDPTKPFGVWEMGNQAGSGGTPPTQAQMTAYLVGNNTTGPPSIKQTLLGLLGGGRSIDAAMWYQDDGNTTGPNYIGSSTDYRVALLQQLNDAITSTAPAPGLAVGAGSTVTLTPISPSPGGGYATARGISYDITINAIGSAAATIPFMVVQLFWHDIDVGGSLSVARQSFMIPVGATGTTGTVIHGVGPQAGALLAVKVQNLDTVTNYVNVVINSTSRQQNAHRWYWDAASSVSVPGYTLANGNANLGIVCTGSFTLGAGASVTRLCSMYTGQLWVRLGNSANFTASLSEPAQDLSSPYHQGSSAAGDTDLMIASPRCPLLMTMTNNGGVSNTISFDVIANDPL